MKLLVELVHNQYQMHARAEVLSLGHVAGDPDISFESLPRKPGQLAEVFAWVTINSEAAAQRICDRAMLVRGFYEVLAHGDDYEELLEQLEQDAIKPRLGELFCAENSYKFVVSDWRHSSVSTTV